MSLPDSVPVVTPPVVGPAIEVGMNPVLIDDVIAPRYPNGCEVAFFRPAGLEPIVRVAVPAGAMVMYIPPEAAAQMRPVIQEMVRRTKALLERKARDLGRRG